MERCNIVTAPQINDVDALYIRWKNSEFGLVGDREDFYRFMTTATVERDRFVAIIGCDMFFDHPSLIVSLK